MWYTTHERVQVQGIVDLVQRRRTGWSFVHRQNGNERKEVTAGLHHWAFVIEV